MLGIDLLVTNEAIASFLNSIDSNMSKIFLYYYFSFFNWDLAIAGDIKLKGKTLNKAKLNALQIPIPKEKLASRKKLGEITRIKIRNEAIASKRPQHYKKSLQMKSLPKELKILLLSISFWSNDGLIPFIFPNS